jgi:hypothetical protein
MGDTKYIGWRKSSYSSGTGNCVEVATADSTVGVRDSKQHDRGLVLEFSHIAWKAFIRAAKNGNFDL